MKGIVVTNQYKHLTFLAMLYMTIKLTTVVLIYKIVAIGPFTATASTLIIPFWFVLSDIITEVYGYQVTKRLIWIALICQFMFAFLCGGFVHLDSPPNWSNQAAYIQVLGKLPRVAIASFLAILFGAFLNAYAITKWKILLRGKYFWLRCLGATAVGEFVFTLVALVTEFWGVTSTSNLLHLLAISYGTKLLMDPLLIYPASLLATWIKNSEGIDIYDYNTNFNPFNLLSDNNELSMHVTESNLAK